MNKILCTTTLIWLLICQTVYANFDISPTQMYLNDKKKQKSATIVMEAKDNTEQKIFEMFAYKWTQNEKGEDILEADPNILINPKNFMIKPNGKQIIRVGFGQPLNTMDLHKEKTWRILFKEIAPVREQDSLQFLFNISVPLFVGAQAPLNVVATPAYRNNRLFIDIQNNADSHVQITSLTLLDKHKKEIAHSSAMKYLLINQKYSFDMGEVNLGNIKDYKLKIETDKSEQPVELKMKG